MAHRQAASPAQLIATSFLAAIGIGTVLLAIPHSHAPGAEVDVLDALFTATSAVCVTGLAVVDTGSDFSRFGQVVILVLFQLGGLGLLTFGTVLTLVSGARVGYADRLRVQQQVSAVDAGSVLELVQQIVLFVVVFEIAGAIALYPAMAGREGLVEGAFHALFHSVSAFNNAGFSLYADSLTRHATTWPVTIGTVLLIIVGGLGFTVLVDLRGRLRDRRARRLSLHSRMALAVTGALVVAGMVAVLVLEAGNPATLAPMGYADRFQVALFQGVTPRTAGFNTLDHASMERPTLLVTMLLMFVGGNPGSTAGGVKTLTVFVLAVGLTSVVRQRRDHSLFGRRISPDTILRAGVATFGALVLVGGALTLLTISEPQIDLMPLLFETISAFGTVGLSMGVTDELSTFGRLVVIVLMYLGRIGFLTFALALVTEHPAGELRHPQEEVVVG